jgi:hypothetical protein
MRPRLKTCRSRLARAMAKRRTWLEIPYHPFFFRGAM